MKKIKLFQSFTLLFFWGGCFLFLVLSDTITKNKLNIDYLNIYLVFAYIICTYFFIYYIEKGWTLTIRRYNFFKYFSRLGLFAWIILVLMRVTDNTPLQGPVLILAQLLLVPYFFSGTLLTTSMWHVFLVHKERGSIKDLIYSYFTFLLITGYGLLVLFYTT